MGIKQTLVSFMKETAYSPMDLEELCAVFDIQPNEYKAFKKTLRTMEAEGLIVKTKRDRYKVAGKEEINNYDGLVRSTSKRVWFSYSR